MQKTMFVIHVYPDIVLEFSEHHETGIHLRSFAQEFDALGRELSGKARLAVAGWFMGLES